MLPFITRRFLAVLAVVLMAGSAGPWIFAADPADTVRIGLRYGDQAALQWDVGSSGGFQVGTMGPDGFTPLLPLPAFDRVSVIRESGYTALRSADGTLLSADIGPNGALAPLSPDDGQSLILDGIGYRGVLAFAPDSAGRLAVVNHLPMDAYLYGVLHSEMGQSNPVEALKAQAVAARSFAALNLGRHESQGFDLCSGTHCQVYGGMAKEYDSTNRAVDGTAGLILYTGDEAAEAYYHKNSGGHTQNSEDVWSAAASHLKGKPDPYAPDLPWSVTLDFEALRTKLTAAGQDPGSIQAVRILARNSASAVSALSVEGSSGSIVLEKERIRTVLGTTLLRSRHFVIGSSYPVQAGPGTSAVKVSNGTVVLERPSVHVLGAGGVLSERPAGELYISNGFETVAAPSEGAGSFAFDDSLPATGGTVTFSGLGSGHGVGMSQDGAIAMARLGFSFEEILRFYYTGTEVRPWM